MGIIGTDIREIWNRSSVRRMLKILCLAPAVFAAGACTLSDQIVQGAIDYNIAIEEATNAELLLNVLRARDRSPRIYTRLSQVTGAYTSQVNSTANIGITDPAGSNNNTLGYGINATATYASRPTFVVTNLDSQEFRRGISTLVAPGTIKHYWDQGWPKALLVHMLVRRINIKFKDGKSCYVENYPPNEDKYKLFSKMVSRFMALRPILDAKAGDRVKIGPPIPVKVAGSGAIQGIVAALGAKLSIPPDSHGMIQIEKPTTGPFTFRFPGRRGEIMAFSKDIDDGTESDRAVDDSSIPPMELCKKEQILIDLASNTAPEFDLEIYRRSPDGMIYYLGELARAQLTKTKKYIPDITINYDPEKGVEDQHSVPLFRVVEGDSGVITVSYRGKTYSVPGPDDPQSGSSLQAMTLVQEIFAMSVSAKDLPTSDTIRIAN